MSDGRNMNDDSRLSFDHAGKESAVQADGGEQIHLQYSLPVLVGEHLESACFCFCSADIIYQDVESTPLSLNAIDDVLDTRGRSDIRLYKESRILAASCLVSRGGGHRGTAQCKAACNGFPYALRATGHENTLAFELTAKNGEWIAVCHGPSKRNDDLSHALAASKLGNSAVTIPLDRIPLETLKTNLLDEDLVTCEGCPNLVPVNLQLRPTEGLRTFKHQVGAHFRCSPCVVLLVAA